MRNSTSPSGLCRGLSTGILLLAVVVGLLLGGAALLTSEPDAHALVGGCLLFVAVALALFPSLWQDPDDGERLEAEGLGGSFRSAPPPRPRPTSLPPPLRSLCTVLLC